MHIGCTIVALRVQKLIMQPLFMNVKLHTYVKHSFMYGRDNICKYVIPEGRINRTKATQYNTAIFITTTQLVFIKPLRVSTLLSHHQHYKTRKI
jgi:hypothetical protein